MTIFGRIEIVRQRGVAIAVAFPSAPADQEDSDGDMLTDADEVNTHLTDPSSIDSDNDGMRDDWEIANSFNPLDAADRDIDTDGDTVPNYFEFLVGTDPNNALSLPDVLRNSKNPGRRLARSARWRRSLPASNNGPSEPRSHRGRSA